MTVSVPKSNVPRASVLIAARDVGPYIECAVRSALSQTLADIEVIVVDDASTDDTYARVQGIHDSRLRLFRTDGGGWARARNSVMAEAQGRYLAFLDGDDEWLPHHLECLVDYLDHRPGLDLVFAASRWIGEKGEPLPRTVVRFAGPITYEHMFVEFPPITASALCARADAVKAVGGFDEILPTGADSDLCLRVMKLRPFNCAGIPEVGLRYRRRVGQVTANCHRKAAGWERLLEKHQAIDPVAMRRWGSVARANHRRAWAAIAYENGAFAEARLWMARALHESPLSLARDRRSWITGAAVASSILPPAWRKSVEHAGITWLRRLHRDG